MKRTRTKERIKHKGRVASAVRERVDLAALNLDMTEQILFPSLLRIPEHVTRLFFTAPWRPGRWMLVGQADCLFRKTEEYLNNSCHI